MHASTRSTPFAASVPRLRLFLATVAITWAAEAIGTVSVPLGPVRLPIMPLLWALALATACSVAAPRLPAALRIDAAQQARAGLMLNLALQFFIAKLGLMAGASLPLLREAGWALCFQELGHAFGTLALGLPLALLLGIKREAVGATFSIGRENTLALVAQKYGMASPEGRGVMAEYITGTVLGALFITLLASAVNALGVFDPRSLAMGAGMGSGSMMAAALGAITAGQPQGMREQLTALAAASNLIAGVAGFYVATLFSLPLCNRLYARLEPLLGRFAGQAAPPVAATQTAPAAHAGAAASAADHAWTWLTVVTCALLANAFSGATTPAASLPGLAIVLALVAGVTALKHCWPKLPTLLVLSLLASAAAAPGLWPGAATVARLTGQVQFMSFTTPALALAGLAIARDLPAFRRLGWRIVVVSLTASAGTFLGAALVAELFHH